MSISLRRHTDKAKYVSAMWNELATKQDSFVPSRNAVWTEFLLFSIQFPICNCPVSNIIEDYWKLSCLVANSVHTADTDKTVLSCPCRPCELDVSVSRFTYLCVRKTQHGGQLPSVRFRHVLLYFEPFFETFALQVWKDRSRPRTLLFARLRGVGRRRWQAKIDWGRWMTPSEHCQTCPTP